MSLSNHELVYTKNKESSQLWSRSRYGGKMHLKSQNNLHYKLPDLVLTHGNKKQGTPFPHMQISFYAIRIAM